MSRPRPISRGPKDAIGEWADSVRGASKRDGASRRKATAPHARSFYMGRPVDASPEGVRARAWRGAATSAREANALAHRMLTLDPTSRIWRQRNLEDRWAMALTQLLVALAD